MLWQVCVVLPVPHFNDMITITSIIVHSRPLPTLLCIFFVTTPPLICYFSCEINLNCSLYYHNIENKLYNHSTGENNTELFFWRVATELLL